MALLIDGVGGSFFNIYVYQIIIIYTLPYNFVNHTSINLEEEEKKKNRMELAHEAIYFFFSFPGGERGVQICYR